ncbi:M23 family metallopeptidase [Agrococcus sp. TF02-05]|uniref:M23 family metallopeptidase n=1 Tax=Agrococcus sp. TF02-05 TaxID=2815211 RepID=UPI001AA13682|nr:M23 family metallopeptidase [Agrococcus sp. TF02-05]MBO1770451.1 M23 family metallopeptidase [Agrococcus sp. TF02-05]
MSIVFPMRRDRVFMYPAAMFRTAKRPTHGGIDLTPIAKGANEEFWAPESGRVVIAGVSKTAGRNVMVLAPSGRRWWVGHLDSMSVKVGAQVTAGRSLLGRVGMTGNADGVHAHLELHYPGINQEIDPWPLLRDAPDPTGSKASLAPSRDKAALHVPNPEPEGLLMALSDYDQELVRNAVVDINNRTAAHSEVLTTVQRALEALPGMRDQLAAVHALYAERDRNGWTFADVVKSHVVATLAAVHAIEPAELGEIDVDDLTRRIVDEHARRLLT